MKPAADKKGFTLVELIVVMVILGILAAIMVPAGTQWLAKSKEEGAKNECRACVSAATTIARKAYTHGRFEYWYCENGTGEGASTPFLNRNNGDATYPAIADYANCPAERNVESVIFGKMFAVEYLKYRFDTDRYVIYQNGVYSIEKTGEGSWGQNEPTMTLNPSPSPTPPPLTPDTPGGGGAPQYTVPSTSVTVSDSELTPQDGKIFIQALSNMIGRVMYTSEKQNIKVDQSTLKIKEIKAKDITGNNGQVSLNQDFMENLLQYMTENHGLIINVSGGTNDKDKISEIADKVKPYAIYVDDATNNNLETMAFTLKNSGDSYTSYVVFYQINGQAVTPVVYSKTFTKKDTTYEDKKPSYSEISNPSSGYTQLG